jgi:hypothetical protein
MNQQQDEWSTFKKMSSAPWTSIAASTSLSPTNVLPRRKSDLDEESQHIQVHCALSYGKHLMKPKNKKKGKV